MNRVAQTIKNRLSLRPPQAESLEILEYIADTIELTKDSELEQELAKISEKYPTLEEFERSFPSVCFALATGVGKTRLMGAFIAYLHIYKKIKHFFVLAPNLTIYNKLIDDFSNKQSPKYVFHGIGEFVHNRPQIITGDNYDQVSDNELFKSSIHINVFNISKINAETKGGKAPRIKRLTEYLGESYFEYLSNLKDLVILMDESHHYRAARGMEVINELNPILGLELTATPQIERGARAEKFKNVVYEYSLSRAIKDGFVKEPAIATRKNFDPSQYNENEIDRIKLEDGIKIHEDTKAALGAFANNNNVKVVKPFVLVVAKDTDHSKQLLDLINSQRFFDGHYIGKAMEIHSNQRGSEKDENIEKLVSLENPNNKIEIVIHVNMLKEGWDVTNLYTIVPLRTAASQTLREQTIGRGLRLPYGQRTGDDKVDKLTIVAHDRFQEIIDEANKPDSIINLANVINLDDQDHNVPQNEVVVASTSMDDKFELEAKAIEEIDDKKEKEKAEISYHSKKILAKILPQFGKNVKSISELKTDEIKKKAMEEVRKQIYSTPTVDMFAEIKVKEAEEQYDSMVDEFISNIIEIPRLNIQPEEKIEYGFHDFDLDTNFLNYRPVSEEILIRKLREQLNQNTTIKRSGKIVDDKLDNMIVNELINFPEVDYDTESDLLFKLAKQAIAKFQTYLREEEVSNVVQYHKREIGNFIYAQLKQNFYYKPPQYRQDSVLPFTAILGHNLTKNSSDRLYPYYETVAPTSHIPTKIFTGFKKACHNLYKFDSKTEKDFATILENDEKVIKWLRPALNQFYIYYGRSGKRYNPDFVVELSDCILLVETKSERDMETEDVIEKAKTAILYCKSVSAYNKENNGKPWKYLLIPHSQVQLNKDLNYFIEWFEKKEM